MLGRTHILSALSASVYRSIKWGSSTRSLDIDNLSDHKVIITGTGDRAEAEALKNPTLKTLPFVGRNK
jgi:hypothetical protein